MNDPNPLIIVRLIMKVRVKRLRRKVEETDTSDGEGKEAQTSGGGRMGRRRKDGPEEKKGDGKDKV